MRKRILICLLLPVFLFCSCGDANVWRFKSLLGQENAIWCQSIYLRGYHPTTSEMLTDEHLRIFGAKLKKYNIKYAYLFAGPYGDDGHLPAYSFSETAKRTVKFLKNEYPSIIVLPWIGGIQNKTVHLEDSAWVSVAIKDTKRLVETLEVQGAHIDMEYLLDNEEMLNHLSDNQKSGEGVYGQQVNDFHKKLRNVLPHSFISSVVLATGPDSKTWKRKTSLQELRTLTQYVDQLSFLYFDTSISDQVMFEKNNRILLNDIATLRKQADIQYLVALGTFINEQQLQKYRNLEIESVSNSLKVLRDNIISLNTKKPLVSGISIYCDWETEDHEWEQIHLGWTKYAFKN